jgi:AAA+ ATPase superfamily predicted ATPase
LVLTGSELGLVYDFLGLEDSSSLLYGRHVEEMSVGKFRVDKSIDFLEKGLQWHKVRPSGDTLEYVVGKLEGIVGWLTEFGHRCVRASEARGPLCTKCFSRKDCSKSVEPLVAADPERSVGGFKGL